MEDNKQNEMLTVIFFRLLRHAFMAAINAKFGGERVVFIDTENYRFASYGYTQGIVDYITIFKKKTKRFLCFKWVSYEHKEEYQHSLDALNELAAYGELPPITNKDLDELVSAAGEYSM